MTFALTPKQVQANTLLASDASHCMLYGGSRSGKTFLLMRAVIARALMHPSRHAVLRFRFNHLKGSVIYDTLPKVMELCFPGVAARSKLDKSDWFYRLPNDSEIWFGGLDDKERTEKILGAEFATLYLNECSQIPWHSRNMAMTRLAQSTPLRLKAYYDCNPPGTGHWTYRLFVEKRDPDRREMLADPDNFASIVMNPNDNRANLPDAYFRELEAMPEAMRRRFLLGQFATMVDQALWTVESLDEHRILDGKFPELVRVVVAVDPSGCSGADDMRSDEIGIVVGGIGKDGRAYILEDLSGRYSPAQWGELVVSTFERHAADAVVAEENFGGEMVRHTVMSAAADRGRTASVPFRSVRASRGKIVRAEPVSALFGQGKVSLVGVFPELEDQLCAMTTAGYIGSKSPDRADAMVWLLTELFPAMTVANPNAPMPAMANRGHASFKAVSSSMMGGYSNDMPSRANTGRRPRPW